MFKLFWLKAQTYQKERKTDNCRKNPKKPPKKDNTTISWNFDEQSKYAEEIKTCQNLCTET